MKTLHSFQMKVRPVSLVWSFVAAILLCASSALADFSGQFILTPPVPNGYVNPVSGTSFGGWTVTSPGTGDQWNVNTAFAPTTLTLSVLDLVGVNVGPASLVFQTGPLLASGTIAFDFTAAYGFNSPQIAFQVNGLDINLNPVSGSFSIPLLAGDTFGFRLQAITDGAIASQATLTVTNFVPEPQVVVLLAGGLIALGLRRRRLSRNL